MRFRSILLLTVFMALAANQPCLAKAAHGHHGAHAGAKQGVTGKAGIPTESKANASINTEGVIAPSVLPPRNSARQSNRNPNPGLKLVTPRNQSPNLHSGVANPTVIHNAIGQRVVPPKNFVGAPLPASSALRASGAVSPSIHGGSATPPPIGSSGAARVNVANATNRGSVNGTTVIRAATGPTVIGGPAQARYGINGTTVRNKH